MDRQPLPRLDSGLTVLDGPDRRSTALPRLVVSELQERDGVVFWIDARNVAAPYVLYELAPHHRVLDDVRIARAFTAYQHHSLVRETVRQVSQRTAMVVASNVASLYEDDDVPDYERERLFEATVTVLRELGETYDLPVLVSADAARTDLAADLASEAHTIDCERTRMGLRFAGAGHETRVYVDEGYWQTTIPYWVDLLGAVAEREEPTPATDLGPRRLPVPGG